MESLALWARGKYWLGGNRRVLRAAALVLSLAAGAPALVACSSSEVENDGSIRGTLMVYVATLDDGTSRTEYQIQVGGNEDDTRMLVFTKAPDVGSGKEIKVWGDASGREIIVNRFEIVRPESSDDGIGTTQQAIIGGSPYPSRTFAYVLVDIGGGQGSYTEAQAQIDLFGMGASDGSTKQWFLENSYGRQDISGDVVDGLSYDMSSCDYSGLARGLRSQVDQALGMAPQNYLWYFRTRNSGCSWAGLASVGEPEEPARDTWYNASSSCVVVVQEPAHNFGMQHSSSLRCSGGSFADDPSDCTHDEYGDSHDPMGGACRHTNGWQKGYQGWFGGCNRVRVNQSGTYNLLPIETPCNGIQLLQIPMPVTTRVIPRSGGGGQPSNDPVQFYYLELRTQSGFDQSSQSYPTVLVRVGPDYRSRTQSGRHTWILDMDPSTTQRGSWDGMEAGQTFTDPAGGVSFKVDSLSNSMATVTVTVPNSGTMTNSCTDGGTLATPTGPTDCGGGGGGGMGGMAGSGGMAGRAGMGGMGGMAGMAGAAGSGGGGGAAGAAGSGGLGGMAGMAGGGIAGGGSGGTPVTAGAAGVPTAGSAGAAAAGAAGAAGTGPAPGPIPVVEELDAGCGCRVHNAPQKHESTLLFALVALVTGGLFRRRKSRAES